MRGLVLSALCCAPLRNGSDEVTRLSLAVAVALDVDVLGAAASRAKG